MCVRARARACVFVSGCVHSTSQNALKQKRVKNSGGVSRCVNSVRHYALEKKNRIGFMHVFEEIFELRSLFDREGFEKYETAGELIFSPLFFSVRSWLSIWSLRCLER